MSQVETLATNIQIDSILNSGCCPQFFGQIQLTCHQA